MQTKQQIQQLLTSVGISPNKRLGQHFLIDLNLMRLLVDAAHIGNNDIVLEVGCGTGSLTEALADKAGKVIAVELDESLAKIARRKVATAKNVEVMNTDILETKSIVSQAVTDALELARDEYRGRLLLVANLPYNAACPLMVNLVIGPTKADGMYVTVQKQVADRMIASPGCGDYGNLSILLNVTGDVKIIRVLRPTVFWPRPQVDSAMVGFVRKKHKAARIKNMKLFSEVVNLFMGHRRKVLKSCTKFAQGRLAQIGDWQNIFEHLFIDPRSRPEQVPPGAYIAIANLCSDRLNQK